MLFANPLDQSETVTIAVRYRTTFRPFPVALSNKSRWSHFLYFLNPPSMARGRIYAVPPCSFGLSWFIAASNAAFTDVVAGKQQVKRNKCARLSRYHPRRPRADSGRKESRKRQKNMISFTNFFSFVLTFSWPDYLPLGFRGCLARIYIEIIQVYRLVHV